MKFLEKMLEIKKEEIKRLRQSKSPEYYLNDNKLRRKAVSLSESLRKPEGTGIIAEFKRKSPSKGILNAVSDIGEVIPGYGKAGASAISVLTESIYFGGSDEDLILARQNTDLPILKKDFIIDELQIFRAKSDGADAVLLIAALLGKEKIYELAKTAADAGLEVILEIHSENETEMINEYVNIAGINNRNLNTLEVDINTSFRLIEKLPQGLVKIAESGISSPETARKLKKAGFDGFLIGELFMSQPYPVQALGKFVKEFCEML